MEWLLWIEMLCRQTANEANCLRAQATSCLDFILAVAKRVVVPLTVRSIPGIAITPSIRLVCSHNICGTKRLGVGE